MDKLIICIIISLFLFTPSWAQKKDVVVAEEITIFSKILYEQRAFQVFLPANYDKTKFYPVVYVLDGETHAVFTGATVATLAAASVLPEMIVVGILNNNRTHDFTPTHYTKDLRGVEDKNLESSGGANNFLNFLGKELIKYVDSAYSTMPNRCIIGHSLGGLFVTHVLFSESKLFNSFISLDPSLHWDNFYVINKVKNNSFLKFTKQILYTASIINPALPNDSLNNGVGITALENILKEKPIKGLVHHFDNFETETHGTVPVFGIARGLRYVYKDYFFPDLLKDTTDKIMGNILRHYDNFSKSNGAIFLPPEAMLNDLGYNFLYESKKYDRAIKVFKMNAINYPASSNAFDSLGEAYLLKGDTVNAVKNYLKVLKISPANTHAAEVLQRIQVHK